MPHCHVIPCPTRIKAKRIMCPPHWALVPGDMRARLVAAYKPGEKQSDEWHKLADEAITLVRSMVQQKTAGGNE